MTVFIIEKEHEAQTLDSVQALPTDIISSLAEYALRDDELTDLFNIVNEHKEAPQEIKEYYEAVADCLTCGEYFVISR